MLQLAKRLAHHVLRPTLAVSATSSPPASPTPSPTAATRAGSASATTSRPTWGSWRPSGRRRWRSGAASRRGRGGAPRGLQRVPAVGARRGVAFFTQPCAVKRGVRPRVVRAGRRAGGGRRHGDRPTRAAGARA
ncbi:hypothetical protein ZWY2020_037283 [Hordeum vulgare]|nr:hypothetical protein ZWY2020_037283 [Hordeum vulgare]